MKSLVATVAENSYHDSPLENQELCKSRLHSRKKLTTDIYNTTSYTCNILFGIKTLHQKVI